MIKTITLLIIILTAGCAQPRAIKPPDIPQATPEQRKAVIEYISSHKDLQWLTADLYRQTIE